MKYNFDEIIDRRNTNAVKIEACPSLFGTNDVLPLWVADMDFRTPDFILETIRRRCEHPILGYTIMPKEYFPSIIYWLNQIHQFEVKEEWLGFLPGVVTGLALAVKQFSSEGDEVIVQPPVYYPFMEVVKSNHRKLVYNPLQERNGKFEMDFEDLESKISSRTKLLLLCNPQNPGGRIWDRTTLHTLAEICERHHILIVSDEIHGDMALTGNQHVPFASVSNKAAQISITLMSPSKIFNIPSLQAAYYIIPNEEIRNLFKDFLNQLRITDGNIFAYIATIAAYTQGTEWRRQMLQYVNKNVEYVIHFLKEELPLIEPMKPEASFLIWLNCEKMGMTDEELFQFFIQKAGLGLNKGKIFGPGGEQHFRLNVACPRNVLQQAMKQLKSAFESF